MKISFRALAAALSTATFAACLPIASQAQTGILHKHPVLAGAAAGLAAHHVAKKAAKSRTASGRKPNFAERHPVLTGVAAGAATHHILKKK